MSLFKKFFSSSKSKEEIKPDIAIEQKSLDQLFVHNFIKNNGKFLYCTSIKDVVENLANIVSENSWNTLICDDRDLLKLMKTVPVKTTTDFNKNEPVFIGCEHLIAENGSILLSSNQLKDRKISELSDNFIVYATTSQLVKSKGESLTGIKTRYYGNIPSNISAIKNYNLNLSNDDFLNYGNTNAKNLYLLLFEDL
ncbi:LUD domain-containing protein [Lutibacter sp.]|uniref:LUD domain-containing protein n=1 Tax=Lutibacter sp. TaxID=1925666 RepID=UPI0025C2835C|nr:LUD domain-containing protein [Lutibacter sp.]MCF6182456.1 lactate utilization protein [Lutibacter sp.]